MKKEYIIGIVTLLLIGAGMYYLVTPQKITDMENNNSSGGISEVPGLQIEVLKEGSGAEAKAGDLVTVHYTGTLTNGTKFDSSVDRGQPFQFTLGQNRVIRGWELGVQGMKAGEKRKLTIAPELGYGSSGAGAAIPPNATLLFDVELLKIN